MSTLLAAIVGLLMLAADPIAGVVLQQISLEQKVCFQPSLLPLLQ